MKLRNCHFLSTLAITVGLSGLVSCDVRKDPALDTVTLEQTFSATPPQSAYPWVWWHWMNGNISKEGIRKDLLWMKEIGVAGFHQFDAGRKDTPQIVKHRIGYLSDEWKDAFRYAIQMADSLGIEVAVAGCPGWSHSGGPWVRPEEAMKKLVWRTMEVEGHTSREITLPPPFTAAGRFQDLKNVPDIEPWYEDIAVVAVRIPDEDKTLQELGAVVSSSNGSLTVDMLTDGKVETYEEILPSPDGFSWVQYEFPEPQTFRAVRISERPLAARHRVPGYTDYILECSDDGETFREVVRMRRNSNYGITDDFSPEKARFWRLRIYPTAQDKSKNRPCKIREFVLSTVYKVNHAEEKAGFAAHRDFMQFPTPDTQDAVSDVILIESPIKSDRIVCNLPEGRWRVYRFGQSLTGEKNHPAAADATGLETDKLDPEAWENHFRTYLGMYKEIAGDFMGSKGIRYLMNDSYEARHMTWTARMKEEFKKRNGYDIFRWLPALTGEIIDSSTATEKFLWDWRKTLGELLTENYDRLNDLVSEFDMSGRFTEAHEIGRVFVGDGMDLKRHATYPMSAFWMRDSETVPDIHVMTMHEADIRESASTAHIFGQNIASAESFTTMGRAYTYCPENLKWNADWALAAGLNRFVIHESAHQPCDDKVPGAGLFSFGQWFTRHETWASMARAWMDYLARSCYLLQQGRFVADILLYYGEDNCITGLYGATPPEIPLGYAFDYINPKGLLTAVRASHGKLVTKSGMSYEVLVLGKNCKRMSIPMLRRIIDLAEKGITVCGTLPEEPAGMNDDDASFASLREKLKGLMASGSLPEVLENKGISPDCKIPSDDIRFVHRTIPGMDLYWVRNFGEQTISGNLTLRVPGGKILEVWNPENGARNEAENYEVTPSGISVSLKLDPATAVFLVVKQEGTAAPKFADGPTKSVTVDGPWMVSFQEGRGAPSMVPFEKLTDWSLSEDPGIRYFSGVAEYVTTVSFQAAPEGPCTLQLGSVKNIAEVTINDIPCGIAWKTPFEVCIPEGTLRVGDNQLKIKVANLWVNRIIGDHQPDCQMRYTSTPKPFYSASSPLLPSGLLGPVSIVWE